MLIRDRQEWYQQHWSWHTAEITLFYFSLLTCQLRLVAAILLVQVWTDKMNMWGFILAQKMFHYLVETSRTVSHAIGCSMHSFLMHYHGSASVTSCRIHWLCERIRYIWAITKIILIQTSTYSSLQLQLHQVWCSWQKAILLSIAFHWPGLEKKQKNSMETRLALVYFDTIYCVWKHMSILIQFIVFESCSSFRSCPHSSCQD